MSLRIAIASLILSLVGALAPVSPVLAGEVAAITPGALPCAQEMFPGKDARSRRLACLDKLQQQQPTQGQHSRREIEALRLELRERCAQDPRNCEARKVELDEKLHAGWRDQEGEGHASH